MKNKQTIAVIVGIIVVSSFFIIGNRFYPFGNSSGSNETGDVLNDSGNPQNSPALQDLTVGQGKTVEKTDTVVVHYVGFLANGSKFDDSKARGAPFEVALGQGLLIRGFEEGVLGMKVGGVRRITVPPELGYGNQAVGPIPANSTLVFEVEVIEIK